jgi:hypothetical protein
MKEPVPKTSMGNSLCSSSDSRSLAMLTHLVEIFIKDPLRIVPYTLRGLVSSIEVCMDTFSALYTILQMQMPRDVTAEDGLIHDVLRKGGTLGQSAQTAKLLTSKLGRSVDEMKSRGLTVELRHVHNLERCYQEIKTLTECYRHVRCSEFRWLTKGHLRTVESTFLFSFNRSSDSKICP